MIELTPGCPECLIPIEECGCLRIDTVGLVLTDEYFCKYTHEYQDASWDAPLGADHYLDHFPIMIDLSAEIYPSQRWLELDVVESIVQSLEKGIPFPLPRVMEYNKGYLIIDGHHRLAAALTFGLEALACNRTGTPACR